METDWKTIVGTVAPTLATALGGPLAGAAVSAISKSVLGKNNATLTDILEVVKSANPEVLLKLKEAEQNFLAKMKELGIDLEKVHAGDRDSARNREIQTKDNTTKYLAVGYTLGYFGILISIMMGVASIADNMKDIFNTLLGVLSAAQIAIISYYFGSSSGSAAKTSLLADAGKRNP